MYCYTEAGDILIVILIYIPGLSEGQVVGIVFGILFLIIGCAIIQVTAMVCHRKGACKPSTSSITRHLTPTVPPASRTTNIYSSIQPSTTTAQTYINGSQHQQVTDVSPHLEAATHEIQRQQQWVTVRESPYFEAETHAGEAPPAYHTAAQYPTMTLEAYKNITLSRASQESTNSDHSSVAPPAYMETKGQR